MSNVHSITYSPIFNRETHTLFFVLLSSVFFALAFGAKTWQILHVDTLDVLATFDLLQYCSRILSKERTMHHARHAHITTTAAPTAVPQQRHKNTHHLFFTSYIGSAIQQKHAEIGSRLLGPVCAHGGILTV